MSADWLDLARNHPRLIPPEVRARNGGDQLLSLLAEYAQTERLSTAELDSLQRARLGDLARHAVQYSPHFARRLKEAKLTANDLAEPGGLQALAPLTREQIISASESLFCRAVPPKHGRVQSATTSGSTGQPVTIRSTDYCQLHWQATVLRVHLWHRRDFGDRLAVLRANTEKDHDQPSWGPPCNLLFRTGPFAARPVRHSVDELVWWLTHFRPQQLLALPSCLAGIVAELERTGRRLPDLRSVRTLSETVSDGLRAEVWRVLGLNVQDGYSSMEGGIIAAQCPDAGTYHVSEHLILEVVDPDGRACAPGQTGRILLTHLGNYATPLIRYEIGDYAEAGTPCLCGRTMRPLRRIMGRERNLVLLPDGTRHWPIFGFQRWAEIFPVRQFQFIQSDRHAITARMYAHGRPSVAQEAKLVELIQAGLGHPFTIHFEWQKEPLARQPGGKFEEFRRTLN
jgi:phenylacetate-CoA ligase